MALAHVLTVFGIGSVLEDPRSTEALFRGHADVLLDVPRPGLIVVPLLCGRLVP